jgi:hypothetical protein
MLASASREAVDLRTLLSIGVPSQGPRPLCVPFALTAGNEALRSSGSSGSAEQHAPEALWWGCTTKGQTSPEGVLLKDVGAALTDVGQPTLEVWPYDPGLGSGTEDPPASAGLAPWHTAKLKAILLSHDGIEDAVEDHLSRGLPVVVILEVTLEFLSPDAEGHVAVPGLTTPAGDYHAVLAVGAATDPVRGRRLLVRNSWGPWWGLGGYAWLPVAYLESFAVQAAVVVPAP